MKNKILKIKIVKINNKHSIKTVKIVRNKNIRIITA
jgi:hypothetical protein